jgi:hypothetical protein
LDGAIHVSNEVELKNAVNAASGFTVIALDRDIILTGSLTISDNKDVTLTSKVLLSFSS